MAFELEIRDAIISVLQTEETIEGLKVEKGIKEPAKNYDLANDKGCVLVRFVGGNCEQIRPVMFEDKEFHNAGQNQVCRYEVWVGYQRFKDEDEIADIASMVMDILSNDKVGLTVIQPFICVSQQDFEISENGIAWQRLVFETRYKVKETV